MGGNIAERGRTDRVYLPMRATFVMEAHLDGLLESQETTFCMIAAAQSFGSSRGQADFICREPANGKISPHGEILKVRPEAGRRTIPSNDYESDGIPAATVTHPVGSGYMGFLFISLREGQAVEIALGLPQRHGPSLNTPNASNIV